jgi:hypothetical protein
MRNRVYRLMRLAAGLMLASGCSADNPAAPTAPSDVNGIGPSSVSLASAIKSDIAAAAGNAIAGDLESLLANEVAAVGSFAILAPSSLPAKDESSDAPPPSSAPDEQPNCIEGSEPGVFLCVKEPGAGDHFECTYSEAKKLFICVKQEEPESDPPSSEEPKPAPAPAPAPDKPEGCSFNASALVHTCTRSEEGRAVVKSFQFLDASGNPMETFVKGLTESIHYLVKTDARESKENHSSAIHSLRDLKVSGFLGPNRIWNGFGSSADTSSHSEGLSRRTYTGLSVDTLKAITFADERDSHPYPLSGVAIRVFDYKVVSTGEQLEITTVHKRVVVTFNGGADVPISLGDYSCVLHLDTHKVDDCK